MNNRTFLSENQVNYVEGIIVKRDTAKPWDIKEGGDTGHSRSRQGKSVCSRRESLGLTHSGKAADTFEKAWEGGCISGIDYRTIIDLYVIIVSLAHDD